MTPAIEIERLSKTFSSGWRKAPVKAVEEVSLTVGEGEAFGFIGPNGAGKSTTIKMLTGVQRPTAGTARLFGVPISEPASRARLGYVPENPYLFDYLSPLEILVMGTRLHKLKLDDEEAHCRHWLERFDVARVANQPIRTFSKGMIQRVALAQALCVRPRLLILDEPLSGLDPIGRRDVVDILAEYRHDGGTLFFTSHVLHDVERLADRFGLIHQGRLRAVRSPAELAGADDIVVVRSLGEKEVAGMVQVAPGRWTAEVPQGRLWETLAALRDAGHQLTEVRPALSLEAAFLRVVDREE